MIPIQWEYWEHEGRAYLDGKLRFKGRQYIAVHRVLDPLDPLDPLSPDNAYQLWKLSSDIYASLVREYNKTK